MKEEEVEAAGGVRDEGRAAELDSEGGAAKRLKSSKEEPDTSQCRGRPGFRVQGSERALTCICTHTLVHTHAHTQHNTHTPTHNSTHARAHTHTCTHTHTRTNTHTRTTFHFSLVPPPSHTHQRMLRPRPPLRLRPPQSTNALQPQPPLQPLQPHRVSLCSPLCCACLNILGLEGLGLKPREGLGLRSVWVCSPRRVCV